MLQNLFNYHFDKKYTTIKNFVSSCYPCFLNHGSSRKVKLGNYPVAEFPFEEVSVDLAESLNTVDGLSHLLIVQCVLTNFILVYPLKTKTAQEVCKVFLYNVLQSFNVLRIHQDNGPCFRNSQWIKLLASLNIQIVNASANNPSSRGKAEKAVGQIKLLMKKFLSSASSNTLNWDLLPFLASKLMNHTVNLQTGFKPAEMIFGRDKMAQAFFEREKILPVHHSMLHNKESIDKLSQELRMMSKTAQENLIQLRRENHEKINKTRIDKPFKQNDIVFVLDRYNLPGNTRPLKSKFYPSPYVVVKPYFTTCLVRRLADNFTALYSMDDLKLYKKPTHFSHPCHRR
jgi:transposase InsO family protein